MIMRSQTSWGDLGHRGVIADEDQRMRRGLLQIAGRAIKAEAETADLAHKQAALDGAHQPQRDVRLASAKRGLAFLADELDVDTGMLRPQPDSCGAITALAKFGGALTVTSPSTPGFAACAARPTANAASSIGAATAAMRFPSSVRTWHASGGRPV